MATLSDIKKQIASLEKQAAALLKEAASEAAKKAAALIKQHGLTAADVGLAPKPGKAATVKKAVAKGKPKPAAAKPAGVPKYRDPKSAKTWTGNGKAPGWIAGAKNRDRFLIQVPASSQQVEPAPIAAPVDVRVAAKKAGKTDMTTSKLAKGKVVATKTAKPAAVPSKKATAKKTVVQKTAAPVALADAPSGGDHTTAPDASTN